MRIAQISMYGYNNYGQTLQRFALQYTLKKFADFAEFLWYTSDELYSETGKGQLAQCSVRTKSEHFRHLFSLREAVRQSRFKDFENLYIKTRFDLQYFEDIVDEYDYFVVGSDQVWNPHWVSPYKYRFLTFVPREKKISYAASIAAPSIPDEHKEIFRQGISDFKHLSVREENAVKLIKELTGRTPLLVLDPVFLMTAQEWMTVAQKPTWFNEKYSRGFILTYYLRKFPPPEVKALIDKLNLPVINLLDAGNYNHFTVGPAEFVWLFKNASLVFTNSYHGVAFSILFKQPFFYREAVGDDVFIMSMRTISLLKMLGLEDRADTPAEPLQIDFAHCNEILLFERAKAFRFLSEALGTEPREKISGVTS